MNILELQIDDLKKSISDIKNNPSQSFIDKTTSILINKLEDRDRIIDLELKNFSSSFKLDIQNTLSKAHSDLELKIDTKINEAFSSYKEKISWGLEAIRFFIVASMFIAAIKVV